MGADIAAVEKEFRSLRENRQERIPMPEPPAASGTYVLGAESCRLGRITDSLQDATGTIVASGRECTPSALRIPATELCGHDPG